MSGAAVHSVHIYDDDSALIKRLSGIVTSGLHVGNSVVIVATAAHRDLLIKDLREFGINIRSYARAGRYVMYDAEETLATFMVQGKPDRELFMRSVGGILSDARKRALSDGFGLTVFGEMVAVLWEQGKKEAALELEALWNEALNHNAFHLHCAYPRVQFAGAQDEQGYAAVCQAHSHVMAA
jgi:KaiC/GvpD/RAD55 family RecA-like ATPase